MKTQDILHETFTSLFINKGYKVVRITHPEFKERYFSGKGFLDLLRE